MEKLLRNTGHVSLTDSVWFQIVLWSLVEFIVNYDHHIAVLTYTVQQIQFSIVFVFSNINFWINFNSNAILYHHA